MSLPPALHHFFPGHPIVEILEGAQPPVQELLGDKPFAVVVAYDAAHPRVRMSGVQPLGPRKARRVGPPVVARSWTVGCSCHAEGALFEVTGPLAGTGPDDLLSVLEPLVDRVQTDAWTELRAVLLPGRTDADRYVDLLTSTINRRLGPDVPLHLCTGGPTEGSGPAVTLQHARWIAASNGLRWVYTDDPEDPSARCTWCPGCDALLLDHQGARSKVVGVADGVCSACGWAVPGRYGRVAQAA